MCYHDSTLFLKKPARLAFLDIDQTMTGSFKKVNQVRERLEKLGFGIILVTARTEEMLMSSREYLKSQKLGFDRPFPKLKKVNNQYIYLAPEQLEPKGILDPDVIVGTSGTTILLKQSQGGYKIDQAYQKSWQVKRNWREKTLQKVSQIDPDNKYHNFSKIENPQNYYQNKADVLTTQFRIQLIFPNLKAQKYMSKKIIENNIYFINDGDRRIKKYVYLLTPQISKKDAVAWILRKYKNYSQILIAGDSLADLEMGLAAKGATLLIVGGANLTKNQIKNFLKKGFTGKLIIGDQIFPNTQGPETILAYLANF